MPSMIEAFEGMDFGKDNFKSRLESYASTASNNFIRYGRDLNDEIHKIATANNLNDEQIQRVVEETNNKVYLHKYAELKNNPEREVNFKVASLDAVKGKSNDSIIEKTASLKEDHRDSFNTYNPYKTGALGGDYEKEFLIRLSEKIASESESAKNKYNSSVKALDAHIYKIANILVEYEKRSVDVQKVYNEMCKKANLSLTVQGVIGEAINNVVEAEIGNKSLPNNFICKYACYEGEESDFSLGAFSQLSSEFKGLPIMKVAGENIKSIEDLISLANEIEPLYKEAKEHHDNLIAIDEKLKEIVK